MNQRGYKSLARQGFLEPIFGVPWYVNGFGLLGLYGKIPGLPCTLINKRLPLLHHSRLTTRLKAENEADWFPAGLRRKVLVKRFMIRLFVDSIAKFTL